MNLRAIMLSFPGMREAKADERPRAFGNKSSNETNRRLVPNNLALNRPLDNASGNFWGGAFLVSAVGLCSGDSTRAPL